MSHKIVDTVDFVPTLKSHTKQIVWKDMDDWFKVISSFQTIIYFSFLSGMDTLSGQAAQNCFTSFLKRDTIQDVLKSVYFADTYNNLLSLSYSLKMSNL